MGRYKPNMIDGVAGFALEGAHPHVTPPPSRAMQPLTALGLAPYPEPVAPAPLISEPEPATATLEDWEVYRRRVGPLASRDPSMRLALAVAETQIAKLRQRMRARSGAEDQ